MDGPHQFEPYALTSFDHVFPPGLYQFLALSFALEKPKDGISTLQSAVGRMIDELPFLGGEVGPCRSANKKGAMQIQPRLATTQEVPIVQVKEYPQFSLASTAPPGKQTWQGGHHAYCADGMRAIVPDFDYSSIPAPVLRVQINVLADGIVLCLATNHMAIDGMGASFLVDLLATTCRAGEDAVSDLRRCHATQDNTRHYFHKLETQGSLHDGVQYGTELTLDAGDYFEAGESYAKHTFVFSDAQIKSLKGQCNEALAKMFPATSSGHCKQATTLRDERPWVSSNDVLTALLWMSISQVRSHPRDSRQHSCVSVPVNGRTRFCPPLPDKYLSNAVVITESKLAMSELEGLPSDGQSSEASPQTIRLLSLLAHRIRSSVATVDDDHLRRFLSRAHCSSDWETLLAPPGDITVTSLREWNSFRLDFGPTLGGIVALEVVPIFAVEGECLIKPRRRDADGDDIWEVMVTLKPEHMRRFRDNRWLEWALYGDYPGAVYRIS